MNGTLRRAKAAGALLGLSLGDVARACGVSRPHLRAVLIGERAPSERLADAMRSTFGPTWPFVRGQVDELRAVPAERAQ